jgi:hypothetical protein
LWRDGLGPLLPLNAGGWISQGYGDVAGLVDVSYRYFNPNGRLLSSLQTWIGGYDDLQYTAWTGLQSGGDFAEVELKSVNGSKVTLNGFSLGSWSGSTSGKEETVIVREIGGGDVFNQTLFIGVGNKANSFAINATSTTGFVIRWTSPWWTAIDNIDSTAAPIPEPATYALMLAGLAAVGLVARRRRG